MGKYHFSLVFTALVSCFLILFFFFAIESRTVVTEESGPADRYHIQIVLKARSNPPDFWRIVEMGVHVAADEFGVYCEVSGPEKESDVDTQIELVRTAIAKKPDALILAAGDYERLASVCEEAAKEGIVIVVVDSDVKSDKKSAVVATDNYELGGKLAQLVDELAGPEDAFGVVSHVKNVTTAVERERGLLENVQNTSGRLVDVVYCNSSSQTAMEQTIAMLQENPQIKCMVGLNESSALGVAYGVRELGLAGEVKVVACDSSQEQIRFMENGTIQACVVQNPFNMGYLSVQAAVDLLDGKRVEEYINTGSVIVTKKDLYKKENQKLLFPFTNMDEKQE